NWFDPPMELTVSVEADYLEECDDSWRGNNMASCNTQLNDTYPTEEGWPVSVEGIVGTTPMLVNLDEDTDLEIVALTGTFLTTYENDGSVIWRIGNQGFSSDEQPMVADLDHDGTTELLLDSSEGIKVVSSTGSILDCVDDLSWDCFVVGNMHPTEGLELCAADGACIALYYWHSTREEFIYIEDEDLQSSGLWSGVSLACADLTGNSYEEVAYSYNSLGVSTVDRYIDIYDWSSDSVAYSNNWNVSPYVSYVAAGELAGRKEVGYSFGSYVSGSSDPAMLVEFNGSIQVYDCDEGDTSAGSLLCGVFADWDPLVTGADAFVLPSEMQCLAWNDEGEMLDNWPTEVYSGSVYGSPTSPTALGDLDDVDDSDALFVTLLSGDYSLLAYGSDGEILDNLDFPIVLPEEVSALGGFSIADIDRDGCIEIVFGTSDGLLHCWELGDCSTGYAPWVQFQHDCGRTGVLE
ncbi:MAG: hypothetical protein JXK93_00385, partial [Sphaerochaetaceae bacterium]|nr:hypothetical protein [Sphaerochaetaceae bacterium]